MPILEEQKAKFFKLLDSILKSGSEEFTELEETKIKDKKEDVSKETNSKLEEGGEDNMPEVKRMDDMDKKLQELSDTFAKDKVAMEESYKASMSAMEKKLSETYAKEMEVTNKKLAEAERILAEREKDLHTEKVKNTCSALVEKGFWPAVVAKVEKVMLSDVDGKFSTIKLDEKTEMSISEVLVDILETIPTEVRVNLEEVSHNKKNEDPNHKYMGDKEVEEYAKTNKLSYQEACSVLAKEGKIEL